MAEKRPAAYLEAFERRWPRIERYGLAAVAILDLVIGAAWLAIAANPSPEAQVAGDFRPFAAAVGLATIVAGGLAAARRREDLVVSILGGLAGASFAVALALTTLPETRWSVFSAATIYGGLVAGVLAFRGAFDRTAAPSR
jgi:drug/metabolite transporter (DMT)-like permease